MTLGLNTTNLANAWLGVLRNTTFTGVTTVYVQLHKSAGEPGAAGTANASAETTRKAVTWAAPSGGSMAMSGTLSWSNWSAGAETVQYITLWDAPTGGAFLWSGQLSSPKSVSNGDTLNITSLSLSISPLAA